METFVSEGHPLDNNRSNKRTLVIKPIEGEKVKDSKGLVDPRLWTGENEIYAVLDTTTLFWRLKYKIGDTPPIMKQSFTSFPRLYQHAEQYFKTRGLQIVEVKD